MQYVIEHFELTPGRIPEFARLFESRYLPLMSGEGARLVGLWEAAVVSLYWPRAMAPTPAHCKNWMSRSSPAMRSSHPISRRRSMRARFAR